MKGVGRRKKTGRHPGVRNSKRKGIMAAQKGTGLGNIQYSIAGALTMWRKVSGDDTERCDSTPLRDLKGGQEPVSSLLLL